MDLNELIAEMDDELVGRSGLFNKRADLARCASLWADIKALLPIAMEEAELVSRNRLRILENADIVAQNVIKEAEERAEQLTDGAEIARRAEKRSREVLDEAYRQCDELVLKTKEHLDRMFKDAETFFKNTLDTIKTNRNELRGAITKTD